MKASEASALLERLTDDAYGAVRSAEEEFRAPEHVPFGTPLGSGHLLLGLLRHKHTFAARALHALSVTYSDAQDQVAAVLVEVGNENQDRKTRAERGLREDWRVPQSAVPRPENLLEWTLERALQQAEIFGHYYIGTPHLLLALLHEQEGVCVRTLRKLGVATPELRRKVMEMVRAGEYREKRRGGLHNFYRKGRKGTSIRLELLDDERFARELKDLLVLTGVGEIPDENSSPPGLPFGERNEPPEAPLDDQLAARVERVVEQLGMHIEMMREDLRGLERAHRMLFGLIDEGGNDE